MFRLPLLLLGFAALLGGVSAGLSRLGWGVPFDAGAIAAWHGPLMISAFFGTVIGLERAVALAQGWAYLGPFAGALGTASLFAGGAVAFPVCLVIASGVFFAASLALYFRQRARFTLTLLLGAGCWVAGNLLFAFGAGMLLVLPWWIGFLVLTIAGERLELSRFAPSAPGARQAFLWIVAALIAGCAVSAFALQAGWRALATSLLALSFWLMRYDLARRTVRQRGLTRYMAVCLLAGYGWLAAGSALLLVEGAVPGSLQWDAGLHAILLGFVFSMVFGHAPVILPAVTRLPLGYSPAFYGPFALLHASVAARFAGDLLDYPGWRPWTGALNALALAAFLLGMAVAVLLTLHRRTAAPL